MRKELKLNGLVSIYKVTNLITGLIYIGQTVQLVSRRWSRHLYDALVKNKPQPFYDAIRQYGKDVFVIEKIAEVVGQEWGDYFETLYILIYDATNPNVGYNRSLGGRTGRHTEANKVKISANSKKWWSNSENKERASKSRKGLLVGERNPMFGNHDPRQPLSEKAKQKISEARIELFKDPEFKERMSEANIGKHHTEEGRANISKALEGNQYRAGIPHDEASKAKISAGLKKAFAEGRRKKTGGLKKGTKLGPMPEEEKKKRSEGVKKARQNKFWSTRKKAPETIQTQQEVAA